MLNLEELNEAQRKAVTHGEGPLLVLAGPGSGKTFTITKRIHYLIQVMQVSPSEILVITFTKAAAQSMESRFQNQYSDSVPFGTFHSCFYQFLKEAGRIDPNKFLNFQRKKKLLEDVLVQGGFCRGKPAKAEVEDLLTAFSYIKNTAGAWTHVADGVRATGSKETPLAGIPILWQGQLHQIFHAYERKRLQGRYFDYDDILYDCYCEMKENPGFRSYWQGRFQHILVDEMQDINPIQYSILKLLTKDPYNLFVVGDDDQAIYGFRGSNPRCIKDFQQDFHSKQVVLEVNYRSHPSIIRHSLKMIGENGNRFQKQYKAWDVAQENIKEEFQGMLQIEEQDKAPGKAQERKSRTEENRVWFHEFIKREQMYEYLIQRITELPRQESVAVLFRTNAHMQSCAMKLQKQGIPFRMKDGQQNIYEHFIVRDVFAYLELSQGQFSRELFLQIMNKPLRYLSREALRVVQGPGDFRDTNQAQQQKMQKASASLHTILQQYEKGNYSERVKENMRRLYKQLDYLRGLSPAQAVPYIFWAMGYAGYCRLEAGTNSVKQEEYEEILEWLCEEAKEYESLEQWKEAAREYEKKLKEGEGSTKNGPGRLLEASNSMQEPHIHLMTVHGAKGLEFDHVMIPECNERVFPKGSMPDRETCEEERRILYVAMTRAKESLELLYTVGTKERPRLPSRFISGINRKQFRQIHSCPETHQICQKPSHIHHHPQCNPEQAPH